VRAGDRQGVVEDVAGPNEDGTGWAYHVRIEGALWLLPEHELEPIGPSGLPAPERVDTLQLRLVTEIADGIEAARVAERLDEAVRAVTGPTILVVEAERHWAEPYFYEFEVTLRPLADAVTALRALVTVGRDGWLTCDDDGWRCDLWWSADDDAPGFLVPEIRGAKLSFLPWSSPARRPEGERPLVSV